MRRYMEFYRLYGELSHHMKPEHLECRITYIGLMEKRELQ